MTIAVDSAGNLFMFENLIPGTNCAISNFDGIEDVSAYTTADQGDEITYVE